jgi:hypothetical protein
MVSGKIFNLKEEREWITESRPDLILNLYEG